MRSELIEYMTGVELYPYQIRLVRDDSRFRYILKSRQTGISWILANEAIADCLLNKDMTVLFTSPSERQSKNLIRYVHDTLHKLDIDMDTSSKIEVGFRNTNSRIVSLPNSPSTVRGYRSDRIVLDEYAHFSNPGDMLEAIMPAISRGGQLTINSTPFGKQNDYYKIYSDIEAGKSQYSLHKIHYSECPDLDIGPIREAMDELSFKQEYELEFLDEATAYFPYELIMSCVDNGLEAET